MSALTATLPRLVAGIALAAFLHAPARASEDEALGAASRLAETIRAVETDLDARVGVLVRDTASDRRWSHRADERFLMASTFKSVLCGAVLERVDQGALTLDDPLEVRPADILAYAPVTAPRVGETMPVDALCLATLDMSDNTAANLLIERLGGPGEVTAFLRRNGDEVTRLDRLEPDLNRFDPADPRDTTSPEAMLATWEAMLLGEALTPASRARLTDWMSQGGVTGALIRAATPEGWAVADKSGGGEGYTRNLVAMLAPPGRAPWLVAIYLSDSPADFATRDRAVAEVAARVVELVAAH